MTPATSGVGRALPLLAAALGLLLLVATVAPEARAQVQTGGVGIGILTVDGALTENVTLTLGGNYYLTVATDDASSYVNASVVYAGGVLATENRSLAASTVASLFAGNYSISLAGRGRAALGWDFTNGSRANFHDNQTLVAFLLPSGPRIRVDVSLGDAQAIALDLYDDRLVGAGNATVSASGPADFLLPAGRDSIAYLVARVTAGNPSGLFGLAWTSAPLNPPLDLTGWPLILLWILVPVAVATAAFVLLRRRRWRRGLAP